MGISTYNHVPIFTVYLKLDDMIGSSQLPWNLFKTTGVLLFCSSNPTTICIPSVPIKVSCKTKYQGKAAYIFTNVNKLVLIQAYIYDNRISCCILKLQYQYEDESRTYLKLAHTQRSLILLPKKNQTKHHCFCLRENQVCIIFENGQRDIVTMSGENFPDFILAGLHKVHPAYKMVNAGRASLIGYLLCVINSSHTF
jgi:hypothetical protein